MSIERTLAGFLKSTLKYRLFSPKRFIQKKVQDFILPIIISIGAMGIYFAITGNIYISIVTPALAVTKFVPVLAPYAPILREISIIAAIIITLCTAFTVVPAINKIVKEISYNYYREID